MRLLPFDELDLRLAWRRVKLDRPHQCFVDHPHLTRLVEADLAGWLDLLRAKLGPDYAPHDCAICDCPKANWLVRPGAVLHIEDEVVYNAILGHFHQALWERLGDLQGNPDVGYQLKAPGEDDWLKRRGMPKEWQEASVARLDAGASYVLFADVAAFYENLDLDRLLSDLRDTGIDQTLLKVLANCLRRWSGPRGKGVPQGFSASDILAKLYMSPVDRALRNAGLAHLRYVDDIRVFCETSLQAKQALLLLNQQLRCRGLNLQSAKTQILPADKARHEIDGVAPRIQTIQAELGSEALGWLASEAPYVTITDIKELLEQEDGSPAVLVLEQAIEDTFLSPLGEFNKTLFHYLLTRLGLAGSAYAVDYCLNALRTRPEETKFILAYFSELDVAAEVVEAVTDYACSAEAIYDYQLYQIVEWCRTPGLCTDRLVAGCRQRAFDRNRPRWLRASCLAVLGAHGDPSDLATIENEYASGVDDLEKAAVVMSLGRMEKGRRNAFLNRVRGDGELVRRAADYVRGL